MSTVEVSISRYSLTVNTAQTFEPLFYAAENESGDRLKEALDIAQGSTVAYVTYADRVVTADDVRPDAENSPDLSCLTKATPSDALTTLETAGYLTARTELIEQSGDTYLSEGRAVTVVHVVKPFTVITVDYGFSREANSRATLRGHAYADRWSIADRSEAVPAGWYIVGEIHEHHRTPELVCVAGMNEPPDDVVAWLYELEGFGASTCLAGCATCGSQWRAEAGNWTFRPDGCDAEPWSFDDAEDFQADTIACPACIAGRAGFIVY